MQNLIPKFRKISIISEKLDYLTEKLSSMVVGARQNFQFCRHNIWFLENNKFLNDFYIT